jgi:hypothetical protein
MEDEEDTFDFTGPPRQSDLYPCLPSVQLIFLGMTPAPQWQDDDYSTEDSDLPLQVVIQKGISICIF